jgi:hypothetical protein
MTNLYATTLPTWTSSIAVEITFTHLEPHQRMIVPKVNGFNVDTISDEYCNISYFKSRL